MLCASSICPGRGGPRPAGACPGVGRHRGVQREAAGGVPECLGVLVARRRPCADRGLEVPLQRGATACGAEQLPPSGLRRPDSARPRTCVDPRPGFGAGPGNGPPKFRLDQAMGAGPCAPGCWAGSPPASGSGRSSSATTIPAISVFLWQGQHLDVAFHKSMISLGSYR